MADDERPKKECSVGLSIKLGSNTQLLLVVVDLLSLLRCHLERLVQRYIYQKKNDIRDVGSTADLVLAL